MSKDDFRITPAVLRAAADGNMANALLAGTPGGIEAQEKAGQTAMVANFKTLPKDMGKDGRAIAEALGFDVGEDVDELFVQVAPPAGWSLKASGHSMHSDVLDARGAVRAAIFYKAAFYDRRANLYWKTRFQIEREYLDDTYNGHRLHVRDAETGESKWSGVFAPSPNDETYDARNKRELVVENGASAFLSQNYPDWKNPAAYWSPP